MATSPNFATNEALFDPLQGYDIKVNVQAEGGQNDQLVGAFTSLMFKVVNQTETYLTLNNRIPRHLDGEIIVVWSMEQGLIDLDVIGNTFGTDFSNGLANPRGPANIPRQTRFKILFQSNTADQYPSVTSNQPSNSDTGFRQDFNGSTNKTGTFALLYCRVDTMTFGVAAGRHIVANTWQGTAQSVAAIDASKAATL